MNNFFFFFFGLGLTHLLNKPKTNVQVWIVYKQTNMSKLLIESSRSEERRVGKECVP